MDIKLFPQGGYLVGQNTYIRADETERLACLGLTDAKLEEAHKGTLSYRILQSHNQAENMDQLQLRFDALTSHDLTYVGIIQTAKASGLERFPLPYVLTNCHNTLCAVGGTINEDDHVFGLSAAHKYGGIYLPPHVGVIHQYMREVMAGCGKMILGSDSHTRYGALGTLAIGEGGGELVKQLLSQTYDVPYPQVVGVYLHGSPRHGVGPQDIALALVKAVFKNGFVKNKIMEFVGPGVAALSMDYRNGIDVMTTETTCLSSVWQTDEATKAYLDIHGRGKDYQLLQPLNLAKYDNLLDIDLSSIKPMIALPFHPSNGYELAELKANPQDILHAVEIDAARLIQNPDLHLDLVSKVQQGQIMIDQGIIAGCAGGSFSNLMEAAHILQQSHVGQGEFGLAVYPASQPVLLELMRQGAIASLLESGAVLRTAFCGPCFGAGDTPANGGLSIRHTTRNFPNREGSKPGKGQLASVALMDARSIAATAAAGGVLTGADELDYEYTVPAYHYDPEVYAKRVYAGFGKAEPETQLVYGPNIKDWPELPRLQKHLLLQVTAVILDEVTTTDELIPSGETSSLRSNPLGLAEFTLSRRVPEYVKRAKAVQAVATAQQQGKEPEAVQAVLAVLRKQPELAGVQGREVGLSSTIYARKPGDGSAREQAASCQRVLGAGANLAREYATKRYRSNLINWGMLPLLLEAEPDFSVGAYVFVPDVAEKLQEDDPVLKAYVVEGQTVKTISLRLGSLTAEEKAILAAGSLINYNRR